MIVVKLQGGLGNQMFQYALGRALQEESGAELFFDASFYENQSLRRFALDTLRTTVAFADPKITGKFLSPTSKFLDIFRMNKRYVREKTPLFDEKVLSVGDGHYFEGYWQSEKYFEKIEYKLREEFKPKNPIGEKARAIEAKISKYGSVAIHVRRQDYVTNEKVAELLGSLPSVYYETALKYIAQNVEDPSFLVFSDDIESLKGNLITPGPAQFVSRPGISDIEEMYLMSRCKHHIIANSTFSWWGAWLGKNPEQIVIAPQPWFKSEEREPKDIIPESWKKIYYA